MLWTNVALLTLGCGATTHCAMVDRTRHWPLTAPRTAALYRPHEGTSNQGNILRKSIAASVAVLSLTGLGASTMALPAMATTTDTTTTDSPQATTPDTTRNKDKASRNKANRYPIAYRFVKRYHLKPGELKEIAAAKAWARGAKPRAVRQCESGGYYGINTGNGYYGAYQFAAGTWRGVGGGRYSSVASGAPKFAQDHMAYRLWKRSGWGPWGCA